MVIYGLPLFTSTFACVACAHVGLLDCCWLPPTFGSVEVEDAPCMRYATLFCESQLFLCDDLRWGTAEVSFVYPACNATYPYCVELPWVSLWLLSIKLDVLDFLLFFPADC